MTGTDVRKGNQDREKGSHYRVIYRKIERFVKKYFKINP